MKSSLRLLILITSVVSRQGGIMLIPRFVVWMLSIGMMVFAASMVSGQDFPNKPIRIVTSAPGGGLDIAARLIAPGLTENVGQQIIIENRGGAGGAIAAETVAKAPPDGYTLIFYGPPLWLLPFMRKNAPYDLVRDFSPITLLVRTPNLLVVHPSLPVKSVRALISLAKTRPGELNYGTSGPGSSPHLAAELFNAMAGVNLIRINYRGSAATLTALLSGELHVLFPNAASAMPHLKLGRLRALAVTTAQPSALAPGLPTIAASGLPGYESVALFGIFAPAKTPEAIIKRLNQEIVGVLNTAEVKEKFANRGAETVGSSPEAFAATLKSEMAKWGKVIKDAGIRHE